MKMKKGLKEPIVSHQLGPMLRSKEEFLIYPMDAVFNQTQNSSFDGAMLYPELEMYLYNYKKAAKDKFHFNTLKEKMISYNVAVALPDSINFMHSTFELKINQLIQGGFFYHWIEHYMTDQSLIEKEVEEDKIVLTINHLSVGFTLWLGMLMFASIAFTIELARSGFTKYFAHSSPLKTRPSN